MIELLLLRVKSQEVVMDMLVSDQIRSSTRNNYNYSHSYSYSSDQRERYVTDVS